MALHESSDEWRDEEVVVLLELLLELLELLADENRWLSSLTGIAAGMVTDGPSLPCLFLLRLPSLSAGG